MAKRLTPLQQEVARRVAAAAADPDKKRLDDNFQRLRTAADAKHKQAQRDEQQRGFDNLRTLKIKNAERAAERLRFSERMKWAGAGNHPADFDEAWPGIRAGIAVAMVDGERLAGDA